MPGPSEVEELEPLFEYSRVQPFQIVRLDDDSLDSPPVKFSKKRKPADYMAEEKKNDKNDAEVISLDNDEEDWLQLPPKTVDDEKNLPEDSTIKELRLKRQELASLAQSANAVLLAVEESVRRNLSASLQSSTGSPAEKPLKAPHERAKIVISVQDKDCLKQFRIFKDDKFERLFSMYAKEAKLALQNLVFCFDGDKISATATPDGLGMEDEDIIEVHVKPC